MPKFQVTRAHLKNACDLKKWDLLDKLLEIDPQHIDDKALYTDTWGEWWGLLLECIYRNREKGVRILLKHGANKEIGNWGDCIPITPKEAAKDKAAILALLNADARPTYIRQTDPPLPVSESDDDRAVNRQGEVRNKTGMVYPTDSFKDK